MNAGDMRVLLINLEVRSGPSRTNLERSPENQLDDPFKLP